MSPRRLLALLLDPSLLFTWQGLRPDPWQRDLLSAGDQCLLLNCSRQAGKSTVVAALALAEVLTRRDSLVLLVAPAERQSHELFRKVLAAFRALGEPLAPVKWNQSELELENGSRILALPGREDTIRSFSAVRLLVLDEAARVPDELYRTVRPMLAVSQGRLVALSTPFGQRGWFHAEWTGKGPWRRIHIPWQQCRRIKSAFIAEETRALGQGWVDQEYNGIFTAMEGLVYPSFASAVAQYLPPHPQPLSPEGRGEQDELAPHPSSLAPRIGGIDFGWRNPFAAVWGVLDEDVLWITGEHYQSEWPLEQHAAALPKGVTFHADPAGPREIAELRQLGVVVKKADNAIRKGIAAVNARLQTGRLKIDPRCVNLQQEAKLYRYPTAAERELQGENPLDAHNHALDALRYLVASIPRPKPEPAVQPPPPALRREEDERLWQPV